MSEHHYEPNPLFKRFDEIDEIIANWVIEVGKELLHANTARRAIDDMSKDPDFVDNAFEILDRVKGGDQTAAIIRVAAKRVLRSPERGVINNPMLGRF